MTELFDAVADGNDITRSKPDPEVFLLAAKKMNIEADACLVVEDADAGVEAALSGGMKVLRVGSASGEHRAHKAVKDLSEITISELVTI